MLRFLALAGLAMTMVASAQAQPAQPPQDPTLYTATYVELAPAAKNAGASLLRAYRDAGRKDAGNMRLEVVQRLDRPSQFVVLAVWKDKAAFDAHKATAHAKQLGEKLNPLFVSPNDERLHNVLAVATAKPVARRAIFVVTHVDVPPPQKDNLIPMLNELAKASRGETDNLGFDIWQQTNRPNHFTVVETWSGQKAYDTHITAAHTKQFRGKLTPITGALYDERLYRLVN
jgi:quinol monooxygenase YgiN